jgi:hypothetical protein
MILKIQITTGNSLTATADLSSYCQSHPNYTRDRDLTYPVSFDPLLIIASGGTNLVDYNGNDCQTLATKLDGIVDSLRVDRASYQTLTLSQQNLRLPTLDFIVLLREICRSHPLCNVYFYP